MIMKIAWRNLRSQVRKTVTIGILIMIGVAILVVGNSLASSISKNLRQRFIDNFTSDMTIRSRAAKDDIMVDFVFNNAIILPTIASYPEVVNYLQAHPSIASFTPVLHSDTAKLDIGDDITVDTVLWGIEPESYTKVFPDSFNLSSGAFWQQEETGIMLPTGFDEAAKMLYDIELTIGDNITLTVENPQMGTKIRQVPIRGFGTVNDAITNISEQNIYLVDAATVRYLTGIRQINASSSQPEATTSISIDENDFFSGTFVKQQSANQNIPEDYDAILGDISRREKYFALDNNAWHFIAIKRKARALFAPNTWLPTEWLQKSMQRALQNHVARVDNNLNNAIASSSAESLRVENWRWGARSKLLTSQILRITLNVAVGILSLGALVVIMNTLIITINERRAEIGTMRALGGQKTFVRRLIVAEVLTITSIFGLLGMLVGAVVIGILHHYGITDSGERNDNLFVFIFGDTSLRPSVSLASLALSFLAVTVIGIFASLYPTNLALKISPVEAMADKNS